MDIGETIFLVLRGELSANTGVHEPIYALKVLVAGSLKVSVAGF